MFLFSGCTTKLAYDQKYSADLRDGTKVKNTSDTVYVCLSNEMDTNAMNANHMIYDNRTYIMQDNVPQLILKDFLGQYFSKIETIPCDRGNFEKTDKEPLILVYGEDAGVSLSGASFFVEMTAKIKNKNKITSKLLDRSYTSGMEANSVEYHSILGDGRINIGANRSMFKSFEKEKSFFVENIK